jgi:hypothetical protein
LDDNYFLPLTLFVFISVTFGYFIFFYFRSFDNDTMVMYAPAEVNNRLMRHVGFEAGFLPGEPMAFHVYCLTGTDGDGPTTKLAQEICHFNDGFQLSNRRKDLKRLDAPGFVTEFGAVSSKPTGLAEVRFVADHLDGAGTGMPLSWIFWDHNLFWNDENYRREIARSYPMAIGGDVSNFFFNATDGETLLEYVPNGKCCFNSLFFDLPFGTHAFELNIFCFCCCFVFFFWAHYKSAATNNSKTIIFLSVVHRYLQGYDVVVSPSGCCVVDDVGVGQGDVQVHVVDVWWSSNKGEIVTVTVKEKKKDESER